MFLVLRGTTFICTLTFFNGLFLDYPLFKKQGLVIVETLWSTSKLVSFFHNMYIKSSFASKRYWIKKQSFKGCKQFKSSHLLSLQDTNCQSNGKQQLVLLKQWPAHVGVHALRKMVVQTFDSFFQVWRGTTVTDRLKGKQKQKKSTFSPYY